MTIRLTTVGKTDDKHLKSLIDTYRKRLSRYAKFQVETIPDVKKTGKTDVERQKRQEGELILSKLSPSDEVVLLDEKGTGFTSAGFAEFLQKQFNSGKKQLVFVVGGPYGFSEAVYRRADQKMALSKMTFSHQMVRLFFTEQLYRAFTILKNEPYHHR